MNRSQENNNELARQNVHHATAHRLGYGSLRRRRISLRESVGMSDA